jgi:hypothetical protein
LSRTPYWKLRPVVRSRPFSPPFESGGRSDLEHEYRSRSLPSDLVSTTCWSNSTAVGRGLALGACDAVGLELGADDGAAEGAPEGTAVGEELGLKLGGSEGANDSVGDALGAGLTVGSGVVGDADGAMVIPPSICWLSSICRRRPLRLSRWPRASPRTRRRSPPPPSLRRSGLPDRPRGRLRRQLSAAAEKEVEEEDAEALAKKEGEEDNAPAARAKKRSAGPPPLRQQLRPGIVLKARNERRISRKKKMRR